MGMIKVKLKKYKILEEDIYSPEQYKVLAIVKEMKQWCRDTYGKGYDNSTRTWCWRSGMTFEDIDDDYNSYMEYPVFYFTSEEHTSWFLMRWG